MSYRFNIMHQQLESVTDPFHFTDVRALRAMLTPDTRNLTPISY
jgi:hypothetical protein